MSARGIVSVPRFRKRMRRLARLAGRVFLAGFGLVLLLCLAGAIWQAVASRRDAKIFPPPGRMISVGTHRLHLLCSGSGRPVVVFESGLGGDFSSWPKVYPAAAGFTRACVYDRAGNGFSEPGPAPRDSANIARELRMLLHNAGETGPFVLVGHSIGGLHIRVFAHSYPEDTAGLVLVDPTAEHINMRTIPEFEPLMRANDRVVNWGTAIVAVACAIGIPRAVATFRGESSLTEDERKEDPGRRHMDRFLPPSRFWAMRQEALVMRQDAAEALAAGLPHDLPLILIQARKQQTGTDAPLYIRLLVPRGYDLKTVVPKFFAAVWADHQNLVSTSTRGRLIPAPKSGHNVPTEAPEVVIAAIREMIHDISH
jgi:pimeloyl-ACP methyl ester carboxylesterase